jgi:arylsulfatase
MSDNGAESDREDLNPTFAGAIERANYVDNRYENLGTATSWVNLGPGFAQATAAPFRLFKGMPTEGGHKVTSFAYHPTRASGGIIDDQYLSLMDVMPTFLDIAGAEFDPTMVRGREVVPMDGRSFAASLGDADNPVHGPDDVIAHELHGQRYLLRGDWKILWEQRPINIHWDDDYPDRWDAWQLYNLANDPTEQHDLAADEPALTAELAALWEQWADEHNVIKSITAQWPPR